MLLGWWFIAYLTHCTKNVQWTYMLTRLQWHACDYVRRILYFTLHITNLTAGSQMHLIAHSQVHSWLHSIAHSQPVVKDSSNCTWWHTPSQLDCTLGSKLPRRSHAHIRACYQSPIALADTLLASLTVQSQIRSQNALKHTPEHVFNSQLHLLTHCQLAWL
jgi:hypothetical protein